MIDAQRSSHIADGELVRLIDGEVEGLEMQEHLAVCGACRARMEALRETGARLDDLLAGPVDLRAPSFDPDFLAAMERGSAVEDPVGWAIPGFGLAAAAVVATLLLLASPAGAWIAARIEAAFSGAAEPTELVAPAAANPSAAVVGSRVSSVVAGTRLVLRLSRSEMPERVRVSRAPDGRATAQVSGTTVAADMVVRPDGFEVLSAGGTLEVKVPATVERIEVWIDGVPTSFWPDTEGGKLPWEAITPAR